MQRRIKPFVDNGFAIVGGSIVVVFATIMFGHGVQSITQHGVHGVIGVTVDLFHLPVDEDPFIAPSIGRGNVVVKHLDNLVFAFGLVVGLVFEC
ncbi:unknown [Prevotella sp. CAG:5226]|nr:unknown [Prevotella sp. CAG:5226]